MLEIAKKKKDFALKDKDESLKQIMRQFDILSKRLEERKHTLFQAIIAMSNKEVSKIDSLIESMSAIKERS